MKIPTTPNEAFEAARISWIAPLRPSRSPAQGRTVDGFEVSYTVQAGCQFLRRRSEWTARVSRGGVTILEARGHGRNQSAAKEAALWDIRNTIARARHPELFS